MIGYGDSDYAGDTDDRKSTSGYVFRFREQRNLVGIQEQSIVTLFTIETDFIAAAHGICQAIWLRNILEQMGDDQREGTILMCDISSTIKLSKNLVLHEEASTYM